jgi:hypothetical protein
VLLPLLANALGQSLAHVGVIRAAHRAAMAGSKFPQHPQGQAPLRFALFVDDDLYITPSGSKASRAAFQRKVWYAFWCGCCIRMAMTSALSRRPCHSD